MPSSYTITDDKILTPEEVKQFYYKYEITEGMQKTCGEMIFEIAEKKGLTSEKKAGYGIDVKTISELTGLNERIIYLLKNPDCRLTKAHVVSFAIGLGINTTGTRILLDINGMVFNPSSTVDQAYTELLENHQGKSIADCNAILRDLGIDEKHFLGSYERGEYTLKSKE